MTPPDDPPNHDESVWAPPSTASVNVPAAPAVEGLLAGYGEFTLIARGGDSVVYRAHQPGLDRDVAVKVVELDDPDTIARFRRELAITVRLGRQHPHIVTVLDTGTTANGHPCLVMDYFELGSLQDRVGERGPLPVSDVVNAGSVVADALSFAHGQGVLHRDVKPQNILVLPTSYVLADFGLARAVDAGHSSSLERFSYRHASPQVLDGLQPSTSDDIYSLGSTLFTLLDGRPPFAADDPDEDSALSYLRRARTGDPRPLTRDDVPPALARVVARCLSREPADRFATAADLRRALDAVPTESRGWAPEAEPADAPLTAGGAATAPPSAPAPAPNGGAGSPVAVVPPAAPTEQPTVVPAEPPSRPTARLPAGPPAELPVMSEPEPVAVSALAHLSPARSRDPGDGATGLRPGEPSPPPPAEPEPKRRTSQWWSLLAAVFVVAVGAGAVIALAQRPTQHAAGPPPTITQSRPAPTPAPTPTTTPTVSQTPSATVTAPVRNNPRIKPTITGLVRSGGTFTLTFTDPTKGLATFAYLLVDDITTPKNITVPDSNQTRSGGRVTVTIAGLSAARHCLVVLALAPGTDGYTDKANSERYCSG